VRPGTTIVIAILMAMILLAALAQFALHLVPFSS